MPVLRSMVITVTPKLDVRKAEAMVKQLFKMMGSIDLFKEGDSFLGKVGAMLNRGIELYQKVNQAIEKVQGLVDEGMAFGVMLGNAAEEVGVNLKDFIRLMLRLEAGGAGKKNVIDLMTRFASLAEENGITGNILEAFIKILTQINAEKDEARRNEMIRQNFGPGMIIAANNVAGAASKYYNSPEMIEESEKLHQAVMQAQVSKNQVENIQTDGQMNRIVESSLRGMFGTSVAIAQSKEDSKMQTLQLTSAQAIRDVAITSNKISSGVDTLVQKTIEISASLASSLGFFTKINSMLDKISAGISGLNPRNILNNFWGKPKDPGKNV